MPGRGVQKDDLRHATRPFAVNCVVDHVEDGARRYPEGRADSHRAATHCRSRRPLDRLAYEQRSSLELGGGALSKLLTTCSHYLVEASLELDLEASLMPS